MNRRCMILVPVVMIALALTGSAEAQSMDRVSPVASTAAILQGETLEFKVRLGGMVWPWCWHQADWYVDDALTASQNLGNVQSADIKLSWLGNAAGTHVVKVRAKYDNAIGVHVWSDYIPWTVTVVSPDTYTVERSGPEQRTEIVHYPVQCAVEFGGLASQATWQQAEWYTDGVLYGTHTLTEGWSGYYDYIYPTFTIGTHEVKVRAKWSLNGAEVWTNYTTWTIEVVPHPPTASCVAPSSSVSMMQGGTQAFTARGTDVGETEHCLEIAGVRWYLDGVQQNDIEIGCILAPTVDRPWSHTFDTRGIYHVEAVFYDHDGYSSPSGQATWTVTVGSLVHEPSATIVSPGSSATVYAGGPVTFKVTGTDAGDDLRLCEVSLDGVAQTNASFSGGASGSTAEWTHAFETPGTYHVGFVPVDLAGDRGAACTWTVEVQGHDPSGTKVSPAGSLTANIGVPVTFTLEGTDPADDLWLCEVSLNSVIQANAYFKGASNGSTAQWTHTFSTPGTYRVAFAPLDSANHYGTAEVWTVVVKDYSALANLTGMVIELNTQGQPQGALADAKVDLARPDGGVTTATTDARGAFAFSLLEPGTYTLSVSKPGYYTQSRSISLAGGGTKDEVFRLMPKSEGPAAYDFKSPNGKYFIEGIPGKLAFSAIVAWNGAPGSVTLKVGGNSYPATLTDLGNGTALAEVEVDSSASASGSLEIASSDSADGCNEAKLEIVNGVGKVVNVAAGAFMIGALPVAIVDASHPDWVSQGGKLYTRLEKTVTIFNINDPKGEFSMKASLGYLDQRTWDPWAGTLEKSQGGVGKVNINIPIKSAEFLGEARVEYTHTWALALFGCEPSTEALTDRIALSGKLGIGAPLVPIIGYVFPAAAAPIEAAREVPALGDVVDSLQLRLFLIVGGALTNKCDAQDGVCIPGGNSSLSASVTVGLEAQVLLALKTWRGKPELGVYVGATGTPEWTKSTSDWKMTKVTLRGYVGVYASWWVFRSSREVGVMLVFGENEGSKALSIQSIESVPGSSLGGVWEPIGDSCLRWGPMNVLAAGSGSNGRLRILSVQGELSEETRLMENVVSTASPVLLSGASERLILFSLYDPNKPWYAATDIGTLYRTGNQAWKLDRITDDQAAEFGPGIAATGSGTALAAWERVSGDISDVNNPGQIAPHMEIVATSLDPSTGLWSTPQQLTSNTVADHQPVPITLGTTNGVLWIQNEGDAAIGDANFASRLMFAKWSGNKWDEPQTLWSAKKGLQNFAFIADGLGEGHVVLAVDEDGDPNTTADCELYLLSTAKGAWQAPTQLTSDSVEDTMPTLVAPNGVPICVWSADRKLVYSPLDNWNPREVYREYTLANEAPSLDAVTMPGGAAIAYTVQGPNGVDVVASFYDADLDCWSLPRQLTNDEHAETSLSLTCDGGELVIAYLKTQTERTGMDVEIQGQMVHLENVPQPGRTDLYVLRHTLANDLAVVPESMVVEPANPAPGTTATIRATIENRGDLPLQNVEVVFYDGDPSKGGVAIGNKQVIADTFIAGGKQNVSVSWDVPRGTGSHEIFVAVDPSLAVEDRDRSDNVLSLRAVLPDLAIDTCWSTEVSSTMMALTARLVNKGVIPAGKFDLSWHLASPDGEEIGMGMIEPLIAGGTHEITFMWDTTGRLEPGQNVQVFAVVDSAKAVPESDETNNTSSLAVFHPPVVPPVAP